MTNRNKANKSLNKLTYNTYFTEIPLSQIFSILEENGITAVDEAGEKWSGFFCGESGHTAISVIGAKALLIIDWYKMQSGRYEINTYLS